MAFLDALNVYMHIFKDPTREKTVTIHGFFWPNTRRIGIKVMDQSTLPFLNDWDTYHNIHGKTVKLLKGVGMDDHATFVLYWIEEGWDGKFYAKSQIFMY